MTVSSLPPDVLALVEFSPVEDVILPILRRRIPSVTFQTLIEDEERFPFVLVRRAPSLGGFDGDERFVDVANLVVHTYTDGLNADEDGALLSEAVRVALRDAGRRNEGAPGRGYLTRTVLTSTPRRVTDWATATGPVQYADLPTGVWRYETTYEVEVRRPRSPIFPLPTTP